MELPVQDQATGPEYPTLARDPETDNGYLERPIPDTGERLYSRLTALEGPPALLSLQPCTTSASCAIFLFDVSTSR